MRRTIALIALGAIALVACDDKPTPYKVKLDDGSQVTCVYVMATSDKDGDKVAEGGGISCDWARRTPR
jgi:hypothetical protein